MNAQRITKLTKTERAIVELAKSRDSKLVYASDSVFVQKKNSPYRYEGRMYNVERFMQRLVDKDVFRYSIVYRGWILK